MKLAHLKANEHIGKKFIVIFLATFIITFAFVAMAVKYFSPEIDVEISKATEEEQADDAEDKGSVDERLRWIQFEDNMPGVSTRFTDKKDQTEDTKTAQNQEETDNTIVYDEDLNKKQQPKAIEKEPVVKVEKVKPQAPDVKPVSAPPVAVGASTSKVYVGNYATIEQAIAMQNRLVDSGLNLAPFVKRVNGNYVVQVGSYASAQKAHSVAAEIQNAGYAARVVGE